MSYILNKSDGVVLTELVDGTLDQVSTSITLVGKNASAYGEFINENFLHLLENFASTEQPSHAIAGQLWYDLSEGRLKVYDGSGFKVSGGTIVSNNVPLTITKGDIWIDSNKRQMHFHDGTSLMLAGPIYTQQQGISGFIVEDVVDTLNIQHTIILFYLAQTLLGIFSTEEFTPKAAIYGFTGNIKVGFNVSTYSGIKFNVPTSQSDALVSQDGSLKTAEMFMSSIDDAVTTGTVTIQNSTPLVLGLNQNNEINITTGTFQINSNISDQNFEINCLNALGLLPSIHVTAQDQLVGIYTDQPTHTLDVNGSVRIRENLIVEGSTTTINTTNIAIEDLLIELGKVDTPSNSTADGGGISLQAGLDLDKTFKWILSTNSWTSSENVNLSAGKEYLVNGFSVLNQTTLGTNVVNSSLTTVGHLNALEVANLIVNGSTISFTNPSINNGTITLAPKNLGTVDVNGSKITSVGDALTTDYTAAVNRQVLDASVRGKALGFAADTTGLSSAQIASNILQNIFLPDDVDDGTLCRVYSLENGITQTFVMSSGIWGPV